MKSECWMAAAAICHRIEVVFSAQAGLEGIRNSHKEVARVPGAPTST